MASCYEKFKDLDLTRDEIERIGSALKDQEFRKLLTDYVEEIHDPENRKLFQHEITQLEKERGMDVTFINPLGGYVIKTSVNGCQKGFINVCENENINKPVSAPGVRDGTRGLQWSLPHSISPPREDVDNRGERCQVFDVVFHPDTLHLAEKNEAFRDMVNKTACEAVETNFNVKLDMKNLKFPKLQYKGYPHATVIRKESKEKPSEKCVEEQAILDKIYANMPKAEPTVSKKLKASTKKFNDNQTKYATPTYNIKHRSHIELENFTYERDCKLNTTIPKELIVEINLPLLKSSNDIVLDVTEKSIQLISEKPAKYKLELTLPYHVLQDNGNAKFDKDKKKLLITLPVKRTNLLMPTTISNGDVNDSGVESDSPREDLEVQEELNIVNSFLDSSINYILPDYTYHVCDNTLAFTLNVKNVNETSIETLYNENSTSIHVKFISISSGYFPIHYAFYVRLSGHVIDADLTTIEAWDNNVLVQIAFKTCDNKLTAYLCGLTEDACQRIPIDKRHHSCMEHNHLVDAAKKLVDAANQPPAVIVKEEALIIEKEKENTKPLDTIKQQVQKANVVVDTIALKDEPPKESSAIDIVGACSESSGDDLSSYSPKCKGILKRMSSSSRSSMSRSVSECSSIDDITWPLSHDNFYNSLDLAIPEDGIGEVSTSLKKTVRFNDHVLRQLFRSNSSILGQRKRNQRKKKRAQERRYSESELSLCGNEKKEREPKTNNIKTSKCQQQQHSKQKRDSKKDMHHNQSKDDQIFELDM